jgi:hypothetical protein
MYEFLPDNYQKGMPLLGLKNAGKVTAKWLNVPISKSWKPALRF